LASFKIIFFQKDRASLFIKKKIIRKLQLPQFDQ